ncbi:DNA uptake protein [Rubidibacter lacunae KORDI 51-2]|uniref:DNA uptake protein n=1 Tax=Rubidibacter lacunae KORDI 51-2 TaxID=582515 RepID=U5DCV2_9CHRO|nr:ComEA family DNA-binding protein [Rubidibacter lacunae]ERN42358.1 DNA uptake protein [Rubidibacter lacunae KORDI 51-2]
MTGPRGGSRFTISWFLRNRFCSPSRFLLVFDWLSRRTRQSALRDRLQRDPLSRLDSAEEVAVAAELGIAIEVNRASVDDWLRLPGISIHQARAIADLTRAGVHFLCLEDIAAALNVPSDRLQPLRPVLRFSYFDPEETERQLDPNLATVEQLARIPLLDAELAARLVGERDRRGPYRSLADLHQRLDLNGQLTAQLLHYLKF